MDVLHPKHVVIVNYDCSTTSCNNAARMTAARQPGKMQQVVRPNALPSSVSQLEQNQGDRPFRMR